MKIIQLWKMVYNLDVGAYFYKKSNNIKTAFLFRCKNVPIPSRLIFSRFTLSRTVVSHLKLLKIGVLLSLKILRIKLAK